jgi:TP901 family phage tail tape measure protein
MADETISTRIVANADFSALIADVHKVTASLSRLQEQLANSNKMLANNVALMNRNFADTLRSTGQYSTHFVSLTSDVEKFGKNLDGGRLKLRDYFGTFQQHVKTSGGLIRELARQQVAMQNAILQPLGRNSQGLQQFNVHIPRGLDEIKNKTSIARQELAIMNRVIQDGAVQLINWGKNTQWAGRQLTVGLTLPLAAFGKASADAFKQADQELTRLTKVYGDVAGTSAAELGRIRQDVINTSKELSQAFGTNFSETISLAADIAATGKQGQELLDSVKETSRLAVLGEVDRQEAMKATLAIQTAFQQNTDELSASINFLNAVENQTSTSLADLVEAIPKAGPVVKQLGGDIEDLALYMTAMREGGINASEGANALKSGLAALINPTKQTVGVMGDFGIDILGMVNKNAGDTTALLFDLQAALDNLNPLQKAQAIEQLFGKFQFARISALLNNLGRQGSQTLQVLDLMKASASDLEKVAGRELAAVTESASGRYKRAIESLRADLAGLGDQFLSIATTMINVVDKALKFFEGLPKPIKQAITFLGALTALAGPLIMITGVLANFFGYILKGVMHMKAFFKGGEGWKYLTPEMLAAEKAGKLVEQSFYSDAKAAAILQTALRNLIDEFSILEAKAKGGAMAVNPAVSTLAGNMIMGAGGREVVSGHPLAGKYGTRASSHMVPRGSMTEEQKIAQTMFGMVPGPIPVNQKIGQNPQIYMNEPLPPIPGLTTIGGASTGVVSGEAARWHAMMATLAMQSKSEIEQLKQQIATTKVVSKDFMMQFDDILPIVSGLTDNAAQQSAAIVAELRAGKITVEQARAQIVALNLEVERMIAQSVGTYATSVGRTINPTVVPTLDQPVVDAAGKSNMRELFKKGKTRDFINRVARSLGVRTSGAGYSIETTRPKRMNRGGPVYMSSGAMVPGPNVNADVVPAMLTPGEFVVNREATAENLPLLMAINNGMNAGGMVNAPRSYYGSNKRDHLTRSQIAARFFESPGYDENIRIGTIASDASILTGMGMDPDAAIQMAAADFDDAITYATGKDGTFSLKRFTTRRNQLLKQVHSWRKELGISGKPIRQFTPGGMGATRDPQFGNFDRGISSVQQKLIRSNKFSASAKKYLLGLDLMQMTGSRFTHRSHFERYGGQDVQGTEYLYQTTPVPATVNAFMNDAERKRYGRDLLPPVAGGRGGARAMFQRVLSTASQRGGYRGAAVPTARDLTASRRSASPMQRNIQRAVMAAFARRPVPAMHNAGGMIYMNRGGMVPGYNKGGIAEALKSGFQQGKAAGPSQIGTGAASQMMGMGLLFGGQAVGGSMGQAMQIAGMLSSFAPMLAPIGKMIKTMGSLTAVVTKFGSIAGRVFMAVRTGITAMLGPVGLVIAGITGLVALVIKLRKMSAEREAEQTSMFGLSEKGAKELGISYTNLSEKIKDVRAEQQLMADKARSQFEAYTSAGVTGISLTIKQLKDLKETVKKDMPDTLKTLNGMDTSQLTAWAANIKAQMLAAGKSVQETNNLIYALIESSNKAGMGITALTDKAFMGITDKGSAAAFIVKNLADNFDKVYSIDSDAFAANLDTAVTSLDKALESMIGTKNAQGEIVDEAEALVSIYKKMEESGVKNKEISSAVLITIQKERPELAAILKQGDTIGGMYAKWRLLLSGVSLDLSKLNSEQAELLATFQAGLDQAAATALDVTNNLAGVPNVGKTLKKVNEAQAAAAKLATAGAKGELGANKELIKTYQDQIKEIRKRADEKKKALQNTLDSENTELQMQKLQLEYQQALARGDKDAAAAAQISIQQLSKEYQTRKAIQTIEDNAAKEEEKIQAKIDAENAKDKKGIAAGEAYGNRATSLSATSAAITEFTNRYTGLASRQSIVDAMTPGVQKNTANQRVKDDFSVFMKDLIDSANKDPYVAEAFKNLLIKDAKTGKYIEKPSFTSTSPTGTTYTSGGAFGELASLSKSMSLFASQIMGSPGGTLQGVINAIKAGQKGPGVGSKDNPIIIDDTKYKATMAADGSFTNAAIVNAYKLKADQYVTYLDKKYQLGTNNKFVPAKAMGGYITRAQSGISGMMGTQPYLVGERGPELFIPSGGGQIIPNNMLGINYGPSFNIPSNTIDGIRGGTNNSYNNNVYNIDIDLNGTNVSADDIMRRFKAELALINAKEGRVRTVGGSY